MAMPTATRRVAVKLSRGDRNIAWIEQYCRIPEGPDVGKPVNLRDWQKKEIRRIYDNPDGTRRAILSFGRKNAKTAISAFLLLLHLVGPEARQNSQLYSAAQSREQAAIIFGYASKVVRMSPILTVWVTIRDARKELFCKKLGTLYRALSAEVSTAYGLSPAFIVHDELGQVRGPRSEIYEALETATAAQGEPLSIIISTQAPNDTDLLSMLIDDALANNDSRTVISLYTADLALDAFSEEAIRQANPAFGDFQNANEVLAMAADAKRMPSREAEFRNLVLNQRVEASNPFVSRSVWQSCGDDTRPLDGIPVYGGLDLSAVDDLTALVLIGQIDGKWHVEPTFWLPGEGITERARLDRAPYDLWIKAQQLVAVPGKSVDYEYVAIWLKRLFDRYDIRKIGFDRWNFKFLKKELITAGFTEEEVEQHFVEAGQGFQWMSPALRALESELLNGHIAHGNHPVLNMCAINSVVQTDPHNNRKLVKNKSVGRIDGMVALAMAFGVAIENDTPEPEPEFQAFVL